MAEITIKEIYFVPPVAIARLGGSPVPLEAFGWAEDPSLFGAGQTVIVPRVSFQVLPNGSIEPYLPRHLQFKDDGRIRPVCPFLEVHATWIERGAIKWSHGPLTRELLHLAGLEMLSLSFNVVAANRKAAFRTGDEACAFEARGLFSGADHDRHELLAYSRSVNGTPLVSPEHPIPLGTFQILRPASTRREVLGAKLDTIRIRFTPARGQVYGPPFAIEGQTNDSRSLHVIVPPQNRILNPDASWAKYSFDTAVNSGAQPGTYDGESDLSRDPRSWGVVDDSCEVLITAILASQSVEATLKNKNEISANARVLVTPPHFAPDRRPFYSMADELADRDPESVKELWNEDELKHAIFDLFRRISETASLINVERTRERAIATNSDAKYQNKEGFPDAGKNTMTLEDKVNGLCFLSDFGQEEISNDAGENVSGDVELARSELARERHRQLADSENLIWFLLQNKQRFLEIVRPPFAALDRLKTKPEGHDLTDFRDPRIPRDLAHDMRMPPYIRDSDFSALSITQRQWQQIRDFIDKVTTTNGNLSPANLKTKAYQQRKKEKQGYR